jgi:hypothetical protein
MTALIIFTFTLMLPTLYRVQAQDDPPTTSLSEEDTALLERIFSALDNHQTLTSYVEKFSQERNLEISVISITGNSDLMAEDSNLDQTSTTSIYIERDSYFIRENDQPNILSDVYVKTHVVSSAPPNFTNTLDYEVDGEVRLVEGMLYVQADYTDSVSAAELDLPAFPADWVVINETENWEEIFWDLNLQYYLNQNTDPFIVRGEALTSLIQDISLESTALEDGTSVDLIQVTLGGEGIIDVFSYLTGIEKSNQFFPAFFALGNTAVYTFTLGADNSLYAISAEIHAQNNVNLNQVDPRNMSGLLALSTTDFTRTITYSEINVSREPVEIPVE